MQAIPPVRRLPITVALVRSETYESLLSRLTRANHLRPRDLYPLLPVSARRTIDTADVERLAALSGHSATLIGRVLALPPKADRLRLACRLCAARRGITDRVVVAAASHEQICLRHRRWLDRSSGNGAEEFDLSAVPEILAAHRRHRRLMRERDPAAVQEAYDSAAHILFRWTARGDWPAHRERRLRQLDVPAHHRITEHHPLISLINYPEIVALTALLTDPRVACRDVLDSRAGFDRFCEHLRHGSPSPTTSITASIHCGSPRRTTPRRSRGN